MEEDELKHQKELRSTHLKRLRVLELQAAKQGSETPASVIIEIKELRAIVADFDRQIAAAEQLTKKRLSKTTTTPRTSQLVQIEIVIKDPYETLTPEIQGATLRAVAALADISLEQVKLVSVKPGSTVYILEVPFDIAEKLVGLYYANDPMLEQLDITYIRKRLSKSERARFIIVLVLVILLGVIVGQYLYYYMNMSPVYLFCIYILLLTLSPIVTIVVSAVIDKFRNTPTTIPGFRRQSQGPERKGGE